MGRDDGSCQIFKGRSGSKLNQIQTLSGPCLGNCRHCHRFLLSSYKQPLFSINCPIRLLTELPRKAWLSLHQGRENWQPKHLLTCKETSLMNLVLVERTTSLFLSSMTNKDVYSWQECSAKLEYPIFWLDANSLRQFVYKDFISSFEALVSFVQGWPSISIVLW